MSITQFRPVRGEDKIIQDQAIADGHIYFATDSGKIYLDAQGERITMGGNGVGVFYAQASSVRDRGDEVYIMMTTDLESEEASPRENDLIINSDGRFFKILTIDEDTSEIFCSLLAVSGSGGGPGGPSATVGSIEVNKLTPGNATILYGQSYQIGFNAIAKNDAGESTGNGRYVIYFDGVPKVSGIAQQGENYVEIGEHLALGTNTVKAMVYMDVGGETDASRSQKWTINTTNLTLTWDYDETEIHSLNEPYEFKWTVSGSSIEKVTHIIINDNYHLTTEPTKTASEQTMTINPANYGQHGAFTVQMYVTASVLDGPGPVTTKKMIFYDPANTNPIISCGLFNLNLRQYNTINIPIVLYDPQNRTGDAVINLKEDGIIVGSLTNVVNQVTRKWSYTPMSSGIHILSAQSGLTEVNMIIDVEALDIDINEVGGYAFKFKASDFASNEGVQNWSSNNVTVDFSDKFDWINGGLQSEMDTNGVTRQYMRIKAGSTMTINYPLFATNAKANGKTLKCIFKASNCRKYDADVLSCKNDFKAAVVDSAVEIAPIIENGTELQCAYTVLIRDYDDYELENPTTVTLDLAEKDSRDALENKYVKYEDTIYYCTFGKVEKENEDDPTEYYICFNPVSIQDTFKGWHMTAQAATLKSMNNTISTQYCEDAYIELEFDISKRDTSNVKNYIKFWIDGVPSGYVIYEGGDDFIDSHNITIGSTDCDVCLYMLKVYEKGLTDNEHLQNFIADAATAEEMLARYKRNDILDERDEISPSKLAVANPDCLVHVYEIDRMTRTKKDKVKGCTYDQYHGSDQAVLHAENVTIKVQGTSSEKYVVSAANIDSDFYDTDNGGTGFTDLVNNENLGEKGWSMDGGNAIGCNFFCTKVNVASCENANNALNQEWYNLFQPYKTVLSCKNNKARDTMQFTNGVLFMKDKNQVFKTGTNDDKKLNNLFGETTGYMSNPYPKFYSLANMGNSKDNVHVFHDLTNPLECCVEVNDNQTQQQWMVSDEYNKNDIGAKEDYFDFRYPDGIEEVQKLGENGQRMIDGWNRFVSWMAHSNPQPRYEMHTIKTAKEFRDLSYNPKTKKEIPVYIKNSDATAYSLIAAFDEAIDTYYTLTPHIYGYTNLPLEEPETYGDYTFRGFKAENQRKENGDLWQKDYEPIIKGHTVTTYSGTYTHDTYERRMAKMLSECEDYLIMDSVIYHYLFIEKHCMIDNVAKNTFWSTEDCVHWNLNKDYDNDTADGNDNNGKFTRTYGMEPMDKLNANTYVFNAHQATWLNFIYGLPSARRHMYQALEEKTVKYNGKNVSVWSKDDYLAVFKEWQSRIPERCWIEDYRRKYFRPYELYNDPMFNSMMEGGQKTYQRQQFETYQETYMSSEYKGKDCMSSFVLLRTNGEKDMKGYKIPVTVYSDCYIHMGVGQDIANVDITQVGFEASKRVKRGEKTYFTCPVDTLNNATSYLYPANSFSTLGSTNSEEGGHLGELLPEQLSFSQAGKLRELVVGTVDSSENETLLNGFSVDNNYLLEKLYVANLKNYNAGLNLSKCPNLKELDARGSGFTSVEIADNAPTEIVRLSRPSSLILSNLTELQTFTIDNYGSLQSVQVNNIDNTDAINSKDLITRPGSVLRLYKLNNINWTLTSPDEVDAVNNKLILLETLLNNKAPVDGEPLATVLSGKIYVTDDAYSGSNGFEIYDRYAQDEVYPKLDINFEAESAKLYSVTIYDGNNKAYWTRNIPKGANIDATFLGDGPNGAFDITNIYRADTVEHIFEFEKKWEVYGYNTETKAWDNLITTIDAAANAGVPSYTNVSEDLHFVPVFKEDVRKYTLIFRDADGGIAAVLNEQPYGLEYKDFVKLAYGAMSTLPYKDDSSLSLYLTYGFLGYGLTAESITPVADNYFVQANQEFFPIFAEKSVYDNVLDLEYLTWTESGGYVDMYEPGLYNVDGSTLNVKPEYKGKLKGKITLPMYVPTTEGALLPVVKLGSSMFEAVDLNAGDTQLTHVFMEKPQGKAVLLRELGEECFHLCTALEYIELPESLRVVGEKSFFKCHMLSLTPEKDGSLIMPTHLCEIRNQAFSVLQGNNKFTQPDTEPTPDNPIVCPINIVIGGNVRSVGSNAFANIQRYFTAITIGTQENGSKLIANNIPSGCFAGNNPYAAWNIANTQLTIYTPDISVGQQIAQQLDAWNDSGISQYSKFEVIQSAT